MASDRDDLDALELPAMTPRGLMRHFGPGLILMMTGIGTSHLITAPTAGGRFQFALLWCVPIAYIFKPHGSRRLSEPPPTSDGSRGTSGRSRKLGAAVQVAAPHTGNPVSRSVR